MRQNKKTDIDVIRLKAARNSAKINVMAEEISGIRSLQITLPLERLNEESRHKLKKEMASCLKGYNAEDSVIIAAPFVAEYFGLLDILFEVRKQELLANKEYIFDNIPGEHILIGFGDHALLSFARQELSGLLYAIKERYRKISIYCKENKIISDLSELLFDEWGVVVNLLNEERLHEQFFDAALFFAAFGDEPLYNAAGFNKGYLVMDSLTEQTMGCKRVATSQRKNNVLYAGLRYVKDGRDLSYELASNIAYQKPHLYEEFNISFVAIYELECYNRR